VASIANENHTIMVLVLVGILNARLIFSIATTKLFARNIFRAVLTFPHPVASATRILLILVLHGF
jgi:hypothetical protein